MFGWLVGCFPIIARLREARHATLPAGFVISSLPLGGAGGGFYSASSLLRNHVASIVPEMECQAQLTAAGMTASGHDTAKNVEAKTVASPAFCIPTSMDMVRFFAFEKLNILPAEYPVR